MSALKTPATTLQTSALINSPSYQFTVTLNKEANKFTVTGGHWYSDDAIEDIFEEVNTAEEVFNFIRPFISTWCHFSIIQYETYDSDSALDFHQTFKSLDTAGNFGTTFTMCVDYLRNY
jgi:hypothetical protein